MRPSSGSANGAPRSDSSPWATIVQLKNAGSPFASELSWYRPMLPGGAGPGSGPRITSPRDVDALQW